MSAARRHGVSLAGHCRFCAGETLYSTHDNTPSVRGFDAVFCDACDAWLESTCTQASCEYCADRPLRPSMVAEERAQWPATDSPAESSTAIAPESDATQGREDTVAERGEVDPALDDLLGHFSAAALRKDVDATPGLSAVDARRSHFTWRVHERLSPKN